MIHSDFGTLPLCCRLKDGSKKVVKKTPKRRATATKTSAKKKKAKKDDSDEESEGGSDGGSDESDGNEEFDEDEEDESMDQVTRNPLRDAPISNLICNLRVKSRAPKESQRKLLPKPTLETSPIVKESSRSMPTKVT